MADNGAWSHAGARRPEPSWPTVIATTVRLWVSRHPVAGLKITGWRLLALVALRRARGLGRGRGGRRRHHGHLARPGRRSRRARPARRFPFRCRRPRRPGPPPRGGSPGRSAPARSWPATPPCAPRCRPAASPRAGCWCSGTSASDPLGSDLVVATPALRSQFGARLASVYAPVVIASFGSGAARIDIRAVAADGTAAYDSAARGRPQREDRGGRAARSATTASP